MKKLMGRILLWSQIITPVVFIVVLLEFLDPYLTLVSWICTTIYITGLIITVNFLGCVTGWFDNLRGITTSDTTLCSEFWWLRLIRFIVTIILFILVISK